MSATDVYADDFSCSFTQENELLGFLRDVENTSVWSRTKSRALRFIALEKDTKLANDLQMQYESVKKGGVISDTLDNTCLLLQADSQAYLVRNCAIKTILERARISGNALNKVKKPVLADILNHCLDVATGDALLRICEEKVSAVHGGDSSDYAILEMPALLERTADYLNTNFPGCKFVGGFFDHAMFSAIWEFSGYEILLKTYKDALAIHSIHVDEMELKPALRLSSSDVGISGANLYPTLFTGRGRIITLGSPLKLEHKVGATLSRFDDQLAMIYSQYQHALGSLTNLLKIDINNPINCMGGVMKRIGVTKRLAFEAMELFKAQHNIDFCTAHDIYYGISEVIFMLQCDGASGTKLVQMEETVARALSVRWTDYDMPGEFKW